MNVVILQPSYIPWRGYFDQIRCADLFVFYDDIQYDKHGWRDRNQIKTHQGRQWLTIPVHTKRRDAGGADQGCAHRLVKAMVVVSPQVVDDLLLEGASFQEVPAPARIDI